MGNHAAVLLVCHMLSQSLFNVSTLSATTSSAQALFQLIPLRPFSLLLITMSTAFSTAPLPTGYPSGPEPVVVAYPIGVVAHISHQLPQTVGRVSVGQLHRLFGHMVYALSARLSVYQPSRPLKRSERRAAYRRPLRDANSANLMLAWPPLTSFNMLSADWLRLVHS